MVRGFGVRIGNLKKNIKVNFEFLLPLGRVGQVGQAGLVDHVGWVGRLGWVGRSVLKQNKTKFDSDR